MTRKGVTWRAVRLGAIAFLLSPAGCFSYMPVELETVPQGRHVRVEMTRLGFAALPEIPRQSGPSLAGKIAGRNGEQLLLSVPIAVLRDGSEVGREVVIPTPDILRVEIRELSRIRTGIAIASGFAAGLLLYMSLEKGRPGAEEQEEEQEIEGNLGDPGGTPWRSVLFSIRVR